MDTAHRKVKKRIRFTDASGHALANREVRISQVNHAFLFGCGAFDFMPFVLGKTGEYREITDSWLEIFNYGTLPFYWGRFEPEEGKPRKAGYGYTHEDGAVSAKQRGKGEGTSALLAHRLC